MTVVVLDPVPDDTRVPSAAEGPDVANFGNSMGLEMWEDGGVTHGRVEVTPAFVAPGSDRVRVGVLATLVDQVGGTLPSGPINPTVDLRVRLLAAPPSSGEVHLVCHPVKVGARLCVGEVLLDAGDPKRPFATSTVTFMNRRIGEAGTAYGRRDHPLLGAPSYDDSLRLRFPNATTAEMDPHPWLLNPVFGTFLGGAQVLLAEVAAEHALSERGPHRVVDLDIRFVNRSGTDPVVATAEHVNGPFDEHGVRVAIRRARQDQRVVSLASVRCRPVA